MSSVDDDRTRIIVKGKGRARQESIDEHTPLLPSSSVLPVETEVPPRRRHLTSKLVSVFLCSLSFCVLIIVLVALIAYSYGSRASTLSPEELRRSVRFKGPDKLDVIKIGPDGGIWLHVQGRIGVDAGEVIGVNDEENDNLITYLWKSFGRWGIRRVDRISVHLSTVEVHSRHDFLANITLAPLELHLTTNPPPDETWLEGILIPLYLAPTRDPAAIIRFVRESWRDGFAQIETVTDHAIVSGGDLGEHSWRSKLHASRSNVRLPMRIKIPPVPGLPPPGHNNPLPSPSRLVTLQSFKIESGTNDSELCIFANVTTMNPLPDTTHYSCPELPFTVLLPNIQNTSDLVPVASVRTAPFNLSHPNISLDVSGTVLPLARNAATTVSALLANFISLRDSNISISSPLFPYFTVDAVFPAKRPKPQILRNVTIRDMKIMPTTSGNSMLASGVIFARVVLPNGINPDINVTKVLPDVLIFDGEVPDDSDQVLYFRDDVSAGDELPPPHPLPDPLPERAFAHIRPDDWIASTSVQVVADQGDGTTVEVLAKVADVPLEVLPGRDREFRSFVGKVIFGSHGALAGVQGVAAVAVRIDGLTMEEDSGEGEMRLDGLPFQGSVRIGKKSTFFASGKLLAV